MVRMSASRCAAVIPVSASFSSIGVGLSVGGRTYIPIATKIVNTTMAVAASRIAFILGYPIAMGSKRTPASDCRPPLEWVGKAENTVRSIKERRMRTAVLGELLGTQAADGLVDGLSELVSRAREGRLMARTVLQEMALEREIFEQVSYLVRERAYRIAHDKDLEEVARMLLTSSVNQVNPTIGEASTGNDYASESVGERCAAARLRNRFKLDRLLHDRDYRVIRILLDNPMLIERDVVKIAAMRPTRPEVLEEVARHRRWASRYAVRKALACNPHTPPPIARRLVPTLMLQDLRTLLGAATVPEEIRAQARSLLSDNQST